MIIALIQLTAGTAMVGLVALWFAAMVAIFQDAFAPQPMLKGRFSSRPAASTATVVSLAERIQSRVEARGTAMTLAPWRAAA